MGAVQAGSSEVVEGTTRFHVPVDDHTRGPKAKRGVPFYNPTMRTARDVSVLVLRAAIDQWPREWHVCDAMASLGARGLRLANEAGPASVLLNDPSVEAVSLARRNADALSLPNVDFRVGRLEPLLAEQRFDWVDIDPYGTPAAYLDVAASSVRDGGILAVTATDKASLCGVYPDVCRRRYNAQPLHGSMMWEVAARILVGAIARAAGRRDRAIEPLLTHSTQHYVRTYVRVLDGATSANTAQEALGYAWVEDDLARGTGPEPPSGRAYAGPLWLGPLQDTEFAANVLTLADSSTSSAALRLLARLVDEAPAPPLYYHLDEFTRRFSTNSQSLNQVVENLRARDWPAWRTHFSPRGIKTAAPPEEVLACLRV